MRHATDTKRKLSSVSAAKGSSGSLRIGEPNDSLEQEADHVAEEVMSGKRLEHDWSISRMQVNSPLQRKCGCGKSDGSSGECEECRAAKRVQRKASGGTAAAVAPPIVHQVLRSPGQPLDKKMRDFFEPRFGQDFSAVRIHWDTRAVESARAVGAVAYTVGNHIVLPKPAESTKLLAHELTHVLQQGHTASKVQRYAEAEPEVEDDVEDEAEDTPSGRHHGLPNPYSLRGQIEAFRRGQTADSLQWEMELPSATVARGGDAGQDFQETKPKERIEAATDSGNVQVTYTPTTFHMLDAMEADIARAKSKEDILDIYLAYFRDSAAVLAPVPIPRQRFRTYAGKIPLFHVPPEQADPDGSARTQVFVTAVKHRTDIDPALSTDATLETILEGLVAFERQQEQAAAARLKQNSGPCQTRSIPRKGGNKDHDAYAKEVTGQDSDFEIIAPGGFKCAFDGQDANDQTVVWEVKTKHEWSTPQGISSGIFNPRIQDAILNMEAQLERCKAIADRCGYTYKWAFENKSAADFMKIMWQGRVVVVHRPRAGGS